MRAVIMATGDCPNLTLLNERYPAPLLPLVDRPFIQHVVEFVIGLFGAAEFDFVLSRMPEKIEQLLGDGTRWGSAFRFHLARDAAHPYALLKTILSDVTAEPLLLAHADRLPNIQADASGVFCWRSPRSNELERGAPSHPQGEDRLIWTGWACLPGRLIANLPPEMDEEALGRHLVGIAQGKKGVITVAKPLSVRSYDELLDSHRRVLAKEFPALMLSGREVDQGIWLSRNVSLHPTARLVPPVSIGENARIGAGVHLGPNAVIGKNTILDNRSSMSDSVIFPGSYVGEALQLEHVIVDKNCLVNVRVGAAVSVTDNFILGSMSEKVLSPWISNILARAMALVLLALTAPVLLVTALCLKLGRGRVLYKKEVVRLPASSNAAEWRTFHLWSFGPDTPRGTESALAEGRAWRALGSQRLPLRKDGRPRKWSLFRNLLLSFLPALVNIARGEMRFVGVRPRTWAEIQALPADWKSLYLHTKAGVVTEAFVQYGDNPTEDELYSSEAFYSVSAGIRHDARVLLAYLARIFRTPPQQQKETIENGIE